MSYLAKTTWLNKNTVYFRIYSEKHSTKIEVANVMSSRKEIFKYIVVDAF